MNETLAIWLIVAVAAWLLRLAVDKDPFKPEREEEENLPIKIKKIRDALRNNKDGLPIVEFYFRVYEKEPDKLSKVVVGVHFQITDIKEFCHFEFVDSLRETLSHDIQIDGIEGITSSTYCENNFLRINFSTYY